MKEWITSDLHYFHKRIREFCPATRPYTSVEEMNETMTEDWNSKVRDGDIVYFLGDFCFGSMAKVRQVVDSLKGNIIWIMGNHDKSFAPFEHDRVEFHHYLEINYNNIKVVMFHYPIESWNKLHHGSVHLHGHTHGSLASLGRKQDVGWDVYGQVMPLDEVVEEVYSRPISLVEDHHK